MDEADYELPRIPASAGALIFDPAGRLLILKPSYKAAWTIPGGQVDKNGETPWETCRREVHEETGIEVVGGRLVCVDFLRPKPNRPGGMRFLFDCGAINEARLGEIEVQPEEISGYRFAPLIEALGLLSGPLRRRVRAWSKHQAVLLSRGRKTCQRRGKVNGDNKSAERGSSFKAAIEAELAELDGKDLRGPASALSHRYRCGGRGPTYDSRSEQLQAYLATRAPATFAARRVLYELASLRPDWIPETVCDLGAGPGTATFAAAEVFGPVARAVLVERNQKMAALGARLLERADPGPADVLEWVQSDVTAAVVPGSDLVIASYVLGELGRDVQSQAVKNWFSATRGELVILEPGTPAGFERLRTARTELISVGAYVTAPCPHEDACPMEGSNWCHFAVRLERSVLHRELKGATLNYEDEKYAYLAVSPNRTRAATSRLVGSPRLHKGHVRIVTCEAGGLVEGVVSRRDGEAYKRARRARWGDRLDPD